ncbi:MAG: hypothetical protein CSB49_00810 [Proteobacteria bacterium]|nr:MAG: hypothetical protein CSB49_00810 [Pseudomonadota bacterium]
MLATSGSSMARRDVAAEVIARLLKQLATGTIAARDRAAQRLYLLGDPRGNAGVLALAEHRDPMRRARGVWALSVVRPPGSKALLLRRSGDNAPAVRREVARALGLLRSGKKGAKVLRRMLGDKVGAVRQAAVFALARLGVVGLSGLRQALRAKPLVLRLLAVRGLAASKQPLARALLRRATRRNREPVRLLAATALERKGDPLGARTLITLATAGTAKGVRLQAITTLGKVKTAQARRALRRLVRVRDQQLRRAAADALAQQRGSR